MPITYPLRLPRVSGFAGLQIFKNSVVGETQSPYSGVGQVQVHPGQWWDGVITLPALNRAKSPAWEAFFGKLNGKEGTFLMYDPERSRPRGLASENIITDVAGKPVLDSNGEFTLNGLDEPFVDGTFPARSQEIAITGLRPNLTGWLLEGDYIQLGTGSQTRLHQVLGNVNSNASGDATLSIWPRTRDQMQPTDAVIFTNAKCVFRLSDNRQGVSRRPGGLADCQFACKEAL